MTKHRLRAVESQRLDRNPNLTGTRGRRLEFLDAQNLGAAELVETNDT